MRLASLVSLAALASACRSDPPAPEPEPLPLPAGVESRFDVGTASRTRFLPGESGRLYLWTADAAPDTALRVERIGSDPVEDQDSGRETVPWLAVDVAAGIPITVIVGAPSPGGPCELVARLETASEERRAASAGAAAELDRIQAERSTRPPAESREAVAAWIDAEIERGDDGARALELDRALSRAARIALELGELRTAEAGALAAVERMTPVRPPDHRDVFEARQTAAVALIQRGDAAGARPLLELALASAERTLPPDHGDVQRLRLHVASVLAETGDIRGAIGLEEQVVAVYARTKPSDDPGYLAARTNLALDLRDVGELDRARELQEDVLAVHRRLHPEGHVDVAGAQLNLGITLAEAGDRVVSRDLKEAALDGYSRLLPADHPHVLRALQSVANARRSLGDAQGALVLLERAVGTLERSLAEDHPRVLLAREALALAAIEAGDPVRGRDLLERLLEIRMRSLPADHDDVQGLRHNLSKALLDAGDFARALDVAVEGLEIRERSLGETHPRTIDARVNVAIALKGLGRLEEAAGREEEVLRDLESSADANARRIALNNLASTRMRLGDRERAAETAIELGRDLRRELERLERASSPTEIETSAAEMRRYLFTMLTIGERCRDTAAAVALDRETFETLERMRSAGVEAARSLRTIRAPEVDLLAEAARRASTDLARLAHEEAGAASLLDARIALERTERELRAARLRAVASSPPTAASGIEALARTLGPEEAWIGFARYDREELGSGASTTSPPEPAFAAFILRPGAPLVRVDLGPAGPIEAEVGRWRESTVGEAADVPSRGVGAAAGAGRPPAGGGMDLVDLVIRPLLSTVGSARVLHVAPDDVLHLVPLDALEVDGRLLGDRFEIVLRTSVREVVEPDAAVAADGALLALGGIEYDASPAGGADRRLAERAGSAVFEPLPETEGEVERIAELWEESSGRADPPLTGIRASRSELAARTAGARFLHLATHGWFEARGGDAEMRSGSPLLLCGLALAGANLPASASGNAEGRILAEEVARLELSSCELAVLSACETSVGVRRAGQGLASLQKALRMAGARTVVTSSWKVPDEATRELMLEFYRGIWVAKLPKSRALWEAKRKLREARDESGRPRYATRDWGAWVLTGDPR